MLKGFGGNVSITQQGSISVAMTG